MKHGNFWIAVISSNRPMNVRPTESKIGAAATWYVKGDKKLYELSGAKNVIASGKLSASRNAGMNDAFQKGLALIQLDDDLKRVALVLDKKRTQETTVLSAAEMMRVGAEATGAKLAGVAPTANPYFFNPKKPVTTDGFIIGSFMVILPNELRCDEEMTLKEDYDLTLQHIERFGGVHRRNDIIAEFQHYRNAGGVVDYRTGAEEHRNIAHLKKKWGDAIRDNAKRKNEILIRS